MNNSEIIENEIIALKAIYPDYCYQIGKSKVNFSFQLKNGTALLKVHLHSDYPFTRQPDYTISLPNNPHLSSSDSIAFQKEILRVIDEKFTELFAHEEVLYVWVDWLKQLLGDRYGAEEEEDLIENDGDVVSILNNVTNNTLDFCAERYKIPEGCPEIFHSDPFTEKKSIFIAHVAKISSLKDVTLVKEALMSNKSISKATHNILAYYIVKDQIIKKDSDDDGETNAGGRLLHLLELTGAENVVVVVSRWYGGVKLGL